MSNLSWGMQFRTCGNFQASTDSSLVDSPKISTNTKATPPLLRLRFCESQNLGENSEKNAESRLDFAFPQNLIKKSNKKPLKSFCYFLLSQKVEFPLSLNLNLPSKVDSQNLTLDSANQNNPSLRDSARNAQNCGNPH